MAQFRNSRMAHLRIEHLEGRDLPSAAPWVVEEFSKTTQDGLPQNWAQWSNHEKATFGVTAGGLGDPTGLTSTGSSHTESRTWHEAPLKADVQARVAVYLDSLVPASLFVRGQNLETATPSFYGVSVTRGLDLELFKVVDGNTTVLASLPSKEWLSNTWVELVLTAEGDTLSAQVQRLDTQHYLTESGTWQGTPTHAFEVTDTSLNQAGSAGLARSARVAGEAIFDNFQVSNDFPRRDYQPVHEQQFASVGGQSIPNGWREWHSRPSSSFQMSPNRALVGGSALESYGGSQGVSRAWLEAEMPEDLYVSSAIYLNSLIPAQVLLRGSNLESDTPSYYAASFTRGLELQLLQVIDGETTVLASMDTQGWQTGEWIQVTLRSVGDQLGVQVYRPATGSYLNVDGQWQVGPTWAMQLTDTAIQGPGHVGVGRSDNYAGSVVFDNFVVSTVTDRQGPPGSVQVDLNSQARGDKPEGWQQWTNGEKGRFRISGVNALDPENILISSGAEGLQAHLWYPGIEATDLELASSVFIEPGAVAELIIHGQGLDTPTPDFDGVRITDNSITLLRADAGTLTTLAEMRPESSLADQWLQVRLRGEDGQLAAEVIRLDTGEFLSKQGTWQADRTAALRATPPEAQKSGFVGFVRSDASLGRVLYDQITISPRLIATPTQPPLLPPPAAEAPAPSDPITPPPSELVNPPEVVSPPVVPPPPPPPVVVSPPIVPPLPVSPPPLVVPPVTPPPAFQPDQEVVDDRIIDDGNDTRPDLAQKYDHIRIAKLAYIGTPFTSFEEDLLRNSVDLVIPNPIYLETINELSPETPQLLYSNVSNIYLGLLTDWLAWADENGHDRESAFYHVREATPFFGSSASSRPVNWFWSVQLSKEGDWTNRTTAARAAGDPLTFASRGEAVAIGYLEKFREINVQLSRRAGPSWSSSLEYVTAVDAEGNPTAWAPLTPSSDSTQGLRQSGTILFDPPADWVPASINGSDRFYYVRFLTTGSGRAPVATQVLGRDYVQARGGDEGVIPAFDFNADRDGDGYLNDAEYAQRATGHDARFVYETRLTYPAYGQNRFATNLADPAYQAWTIDYSQRLLAANPLASGLFMDNSIGRLQVDGAQLYESIDNYSEEYGALLGAINRNLGDGWVLANIAGAGSSADAIVANGVSTLDEFALRPLAHHHSQFEDMAKLVEDRLAALDDRGYLILDTLPQGGDPTDARTQVSALAYYYLLADPNDTLLMFFGGHEPSTSWTRHWTDAVDYNVGQPLEDWSEFATGQDPTAPNLAYKVFQREYENALVLYKPLSYTLRQGTGTTADNTATVHQLDRVYRPLNADGTLGAPTTRVSLRNGEGTILVKA